jgi:hypothetical protein
MDLRELINDPQENLRMALTGLQVRMWTALPGIIQSFDPVAMTCVVQPAIRARWTQPVPAKSASTTKVTTIRQATQYKTTLLDFPPLPDCPVVFPQGGGAMMSFPLQPGDECLIVFASRGIDWWWQQGGVQPPAECRMHDINDGFVIPGPFSQPRTPSNTNAGRPPSPDLVELRSVDGSQSLSFNPKSGAVSVTGSLNVGSSAMIGNGASGSFTTPTGQTVTVQNGIITNLS